MTITNTTTPPIKVRVRPLVVGYGQAFAGKTGLAVWGKSYGYSTVTFDDGTIQTIRDINLQVIQTGSAMLPVSFNLNES